MSLVLSARRFLSPYGDELIEPDETFSVVLSNLSGAGAVISNTTSVITIRDDDTVAATPTVSVGDITIAEGDKLKRTMAEVTISLSRHQMHL